MTTPNAQYQEEGTNRGNVMYEVCTRCDRQYPCWYAPNNLWNRVTKNEPGLMLCPQCFERDCAYLNLNIIFRCNTIADDVELDKLREELKSLRTQMEEGEKWTKIEWGCDLPPEHGACLAFHPDWGVHFGWRSAMNIRGDWAGDVPATHWLHLPAPPRSLEGGGK